MQGKGSNASKIARARADAIKRSAEEGKNVGGGAKGMAVRSGMAAASIKCSICMAVFMSNQSEVQLKAHQEAKHEKSTFELCFPDFGK